MAAGIVIVTSQVDFEAFIWTPEAAVDLDSEAGTVLLAAGYSAVNGVGPGYQHPDWGEAGDWAPARWFLFLEDGLRFALRWKCAASQGGLVEAAWTPWCANIFPYVPVPPDDPFPNANAQLYFDPQTAIDNEEIADAGPWWNWEVLLRR